MELLIAVSGIILSIIAIFISIYGNWMQRNMYLIENTRHKMEIQNLHLAVTDKKKITKSGSVEYTFGINLTNQSSIQNTVSSIKMQIYYYMNNMEQSFIVDADSIKIGGDNEHLPLEIGARTIKKIDTLFKLEKNFFSNKAILRYSINVEDIHGKIILAHEKNIDEVDDE